MCLSINVKYSCLRWLNIVVQDYLRLWSMMIQDICLKLLIWTLWWLSKGSIKKKKMSQKVEKVHNFLDPPPPLGWFGLFWIWEKTEIWRPPPVPNLGKIWNWKNFDFFLDFFHFLRHFFKAPLNFERYQLLGYLECLNETLVNQKFLIAILKKSFNLGMTIKSKGGRYQKVL